MFTENKHELILYCKHYKLSQCELLDIIRNVCCFVELYYKTYIWFWSAGVIYSNEKKF